jgi:hypothetical protein
MSGVLVGEIIDACEHGLKLSPGEFAALVAIAEKCHETARTGSVRMSRIQAAMGHKSRSTAKRAVRSLKDRGIIGVIRYGYAREGKTHASVYVIYDPSAWVTLSDPCTAAQHGSNPAQHGSNRPVSMGQIGVSMGHLDDPHDGSYMTELHDGSYSDGSAQPQAVARTGHEQNQSLSWMEDVYARVERHHKNAEKRTSGLQRIGDDADVLDVEEVDEPQPKRLDDILNDPRREDR